MRIRLISDLAAELDIRTWGLLRHCREHGIQLGRVRSEKTGRRVYCVTERDAIKIVKRYRKGVVSWEQTPQQAEAKAKAAADKAQAAAAAAAAHPPVDTVDALLAGMPADEQGDDDGEIGADSSAP